MSPDLLPDLFEAQKKLDRIPVRFEHLPSLRVVAGLVPATSIALAPCLEGVAGTSPETTR